MRTEYVVKYNFKKYTGRENEGDFRFEIKEHVFKNFDDLKKFIASNLPNKPVSLQSREVTDLNLDEILAENSYTVFYSVNSWLKQKKSFETFEEMNSFINDNKEYDIEKVQLPKSAEWLNNVLKI